MKDENASHPLAKLTLWVWLVISVAAVALAWGLPVNLRSVTPALLREAGRGTPSLVEFGLERVDEEKLGAGVQVVRAARLLHSPGLERLEARVAKVEERRPEWVPWGGWDPLLDPVFTLPAQVGKKAATPVLELLVAERGRKALAAYLGNSRSQVVADILKLREIPVTGRFVAVGKPGGQALESVVLLTALLYQADGFTPAFARELRERVEGSLVEKRLGRMEDLLADLLSLGKRHTWGEVVELMRGVKTANGLVQVAQLSRQAGDDWPLVYVAALQAGDADGVAAFVVERGKEGLADLRLALERGQGAVKLLVRTSLPLNRAPNYEMGWMAEVALLHPRWVLIVKYLSFLIAALGTVRAMEEAAGLGGSGMRGRWPAWILGCVLAVLLVVAAEPFLFRKLPLSEFGVKVSIPALTASLSTSDPVAKTSLNMETSTIVSIAFFALLQVAMYLICLRKIREIDRQPLSPAVKLQLMKNEENLFDGGLYIGIAGTASALVLQVLGLIQANLLAAYSSNLFGIVCVALVKIRSVRPYKRDLILADESERALAKAEEDLE